MKRRALCAAAAMLALLAAGCHAPPEPDNLGQWLFLEVGPGEHTMRPFDVDKDYVRMSLNYNMTNVSHIQVWFHDAQKQRIDATYDAEGLPEINVTAPMRGTWEFHLETLDQQNRTGRVEEAIFWVLGFPE